MTVFNGSKIEVTITADGAKALYGSDDPASVKENYKVEYLGGVNVAGTDIKTAYGESFYEDYKEKIAGTHYYAITDLTTGQMICKNHAVTIDQFEITEFQETIDEYYVGFHGEKREWNLILKGKNISGQIAQVAELPLSVTFTYNPQTTSDPHSGTVATCPNPLNGNVAGNKKLDWSDRLVDINNNKISESLAYDIKCYALPKAYTAVTSSQTIYYASLLDAINNTSTTNSTIYAMQSFDYSITWDGLAAAKKGTKTVNTDYYHTIDQDCEIQSGVTLVVPYDKGNTGPATIIDVYQNTGFNATYKKNEVTVSAGCTLDNNGTISIAAEITQGGSGQSYNSVVAGNYAQITLATGSKNDKGAVLTNGAKIISQSGSKINCYGFITESKYYNCDSDEVLKNATTIAPKVEMLDGSKMTAVMSVVENRGGTILSKMYLNLKSFVFNRFFVQSVATNMIVDSGATVYGYTKMKVSSMSPDQNLELFSSGSNSFIKLESGTKVVFKYDSTLAQNKMNLYGSASVNPIVVKLNVGLTVELSTKNTFFPLSHYWDLEFRPFENGSQATVSAVGTDITQNIKILPGASITVHKGVTFNAGAIVVYEDNSHIYTVGNKLAYPDKPAGKLIVNGRLNATSVGGHIEATESGGEINISSSNSVTIVELKNDSISYDDTTSLTANGLIYNGLTPTTGQSFAVGTKYVSTKYGDEFAWFDPNVTITYDLGYDGKTESVTYTATADGGIGAFKTFTRKDHVFAGWFVDSTHETPAPTAAEIRCSATLYAQWTEIETYTITYNYNYPEDVPQDADFDGGIEEAPAGTFTQVHTLCNWNTDTSIMYDRPYYFLGWSEENDGTVDENFTVTENGLTLYAVWGEKVSLKYTANDTNVYTSLITNGDMQLEYGKDYWFIPGTEITLPKVKANDKISNTNQYYFGGWTLENYSGGEKFILNDSVEINITWLKKATVNIKYYDGSVTLELVNMDDKLSLEKITGNTVHEKTYYVRPGTLKLTYSYVETNSQKFELTVNGIGVDGNQDTTAQTITYQNSIASTDTWSLDADSDPGGCFTPDTLITLADGTQKRVDQLEFGDKILAWDFFTGTYVEKDISLLVNHGEGLYRIANLVFSDGTILRIIADHGIFDYDLNKFVYITVDNMHEYIGHRFVQYAADGSYNIITLTDAYETKEYTTAWSVSSSGTSNAFASGLLTVAPPEDFYNWIEMGDKLMYNAEQFQRDIETYGLYTYDDFKDYVTYEQFIDWNGAYLKIAVEKGYFTFEYILELIELYKGWMPSN